MLIAPCPDRSAPSGHVVVPSLQGAYYSCQEAKRTLNYRKDSARCGACGAKLELSNLNHSKPDVDGRSFDAIEMIDFALATFVSLMFIHHSVAIL